MKLTIRHRVPLLSQALWVCLLTTTSLAAACSGASTIPNVAPSTEAGSSEVLLAADVEWEPLNPARGDASPAAATLWGDRDGNEPTGFLVRFVDGFSSPPHIHNVSYRGVVIRGLVHNDDPAAEPMWMPTGSYWTQPLGDAHITSASGGSTMAYIEIEQGPYLVHPVEHAAAGPERPLNVHASNLVWLDLDMTGRRSSQASLGPQVSFLWGDPNAGETHGLLLRLPAGSTVPLRTQGFRAVVIDGQVQHPSNDVGATPLDPGSYLSSRGGPAQVRCASEHPCTLYVRAEGRFDVVRIP